MSISPLVLRVEVTSLRLMKYLCYVQVLLMLIVGFSLVPLRDVALQTAAGKVAFWFAVLGAVGTALCAWALARAIEAVLRAPAVSTTSSILYKIQPLPCVVFALCAAVLILAHASELGLKHIGEVIGVSAPWWTPWLAETGFGIALAILAVLMLVYCCELHILLVERRRKRKERSSA